MPPRRFWYRLPEADQVGVWRSRLGAARTVYERVSKRALRLERYLSHDFEDINDESLKDEDEYPEGANRLNLMARTLLGFKAGLFDIDPTIENPRTGDMDDETATFEEVAIENVMAEGRSGAAWEEATDHIMTVGSGLVWTGMDSEVMTARRLLSQGVSLAAYVNSVRAGEAEPVVLPGMDPVLLQRVAQSILGDEAEGRTLSLEERHNLMNLAEECEERMEEESGKRIHERMKRRRVYYKPLRYGVDCWWDETVRSFEDADWFIRAIDMPLDHFLELCGPSTDPDALFKERAGREVKARVPSTEEGGVKMEATEDLDEQLIENTIGNVRVYELWLKSRFERRYFVDGLNFWINHDHTYPFMDENGESWMPGFIPVSKATPISNPRRKPEASIGIPALAFGEDQQLDMLRTRDAYIRACKRSARIFEADSTIANDDDLKEAIRRGEDGLIVPRSPNAKQRALEPVNDPGAPGDYLEASNHLMYDFAAGVGVTMPALTGQPVADTLGQEQIAVEAIGMTTIYMANKVQAAVALTAEQTRAYIRHTMSKEELQKYASTRYFEPKQLPNGEQGPSVFDRWKASSPKGDRLKAYLAYSQRTTDLAQRKQAMDFLELLLNARDSTGLPYADPMPFLERLAKLMDQGTLKPYTPTRAELAAIIAKAQAEAMGAGGEGEGGPPSGETSGGGDSAPGERSDNRLAGGKRGKRAIPNRQKRSRGPSGRSSENTRADRR